VIVGIVIGTVPGTMHASMVIWYRDGSHWAGSADGPTCYDATLALLSMAREEGVE
jgi:hypothetical protein